MTESAELTNLVEDFAGDLAGLLPDPGAWGIWLSLLLEELERQAATTGQPAERFDLALMLVQKAAGDRLESHQR